MKIAIVVSTFPPYSGGMGNLARSYALELTERGHEVTVFCPAYGRTEGPESGPYRIRRLHSPLRFHNSAFLPQLYFELRPFDVVNLHYPFYGGAETVLLLKKVLRSKLPLAITFAMDNFKDGLVGASMAAYARIVLPSVLRAGERIIVLSLDYAVHSAAGDAYRRCPEKFRPIPPGVDTRRFSPRPKSQERLLKYGIRSDERVVLFVGGLDAAHSFKGVDFLLKTWALRKPPRSRLIIVGRGGLKGRYMRMAKDLGIAGSVVFDDAVRDDDLPVTYNLADLLVLPSVNRSEAFGIVLIEAMASGVPVLASDLPGVRSVIEKGQNGFTFPVEDGVALAEKMCLYLEDRNLRERMAAASRAIAIAGYERTVIGARIERTIYETYEACSRLKDGDA